MRNIIRNFLDDNGFEYEENVLRIIVDCGGNAFDFIRLIQLISAEIESWTYEDLATFEDEKNVKIDIDCAYETVRFNF